MFLTNTKMYELWNGMDILRGQKVFQGWYGMEAKEWIEFGVFNEDSPAVAYQKVSDGIRAKLEKKAYGWFMCEDCGGIDCGHIWSQLTEVPKEMLERFPQEIEN